MAKNKSILTTRKPNVKKQERFGIELERLRIRTKRRKS